MAISSYSIAMSDNATIEIFRPSKVIFITTIVIGVFLIPAFLLGFIVILVALLNYMTTRVEVGANSVTQVKGWITKTHTEIPFNKINSVKVRTYGSRRYGDVTIFTGNDVSGIKLSAIDDARRLKEVIQSRIDSSGTGVSQHSKPAGGSNIEQLERLASLRKQGLITDDEFKKEKSRVLSS